VVVALKQSTCMELIGNRKFRAIEMANWHGAVQAHWESRYPGIHEAEAMP
jgi:hypothetical protein